MVEELKMGIYRICIPFDDIYTSSFVLTENNDAIILDSGSNDEDVEKYIIPEVARLGVNVIHLVSSHCHGDHNGGIEALKKAYTNADHLCFADGSIENNEILLSRYRALNLKGHCDDSLSILDTKTNTLLSCDSLQAYGVAKFKTLVSDRQKYLNSVELVKNLNLNSIIASHEYVPCGSIVDKENIQFFLQKCIDAIKYEQCP